VSNRKYNLRLARMLLAAITVSCKENNLNSIFIAIDEPKK
jgi:hypothetical protein